MNALLTVDGLACGQPSPVLRAVTFTVAAGHAYQLTGLTCSGKSTLLDALAGLTARTGDMHIAGHRSTTWPAWRLARHVAYAPQGRRVWTNLTVADHLHLVRTQPGPHPLTRMSVLDLFPPLAARLRQRADTLSGGEARMLCLARALLRGQPLLLLDEPTEGLTTTIAGALRDTLTGLKQHGTAIVFVDSTSQLRRLAEHTLTAADGTVRPAQPAGARQ